MGGVSSFKKNVFVEQQFSTYFEGYGLYEDADYSLRALKYGTNVINTKLQLEHHHHPEGRPNKFKYGLMVIRNGWYVWRVKYPKPSLKARFKWNAIAFLLTLIRFGNVITTSERKSALTEALGRKYGWCSLLLNKPKLQR
jgi:GT2 family glycosyltransferase